MPADKCVDFRDLIWFSEVTDPHHSLALQSFECNHTSVLICFNSCDRKRISPMLIGRDGACMAHAWRSWSLQPFELNGSIAYAQPLPILPTLPDIYAISCRSWPESAAVRHDWSFNDSHNVLLLDCHRSTDVTSEMPKCHHVHLDIVDMVRRRAANVKNVDWQLTSKYPRCVFLVATDYMEPKHRFTLLVTRDSKSSS